MPDPYDILEGTLRRARKGPGFKYRPLYHESSEHEQSLADEFVEDMEEEGDEDAVFKKFLRKGLRRPGTEKARVEAYLMRAYKKAKEEGRL